MLEFAVLGLLTEGPLHGYELRKRLSTRFGAVRRVSFGSLYPTLRRMQSLGWVEAGPPDGRPGGLGGRSKVVYELTAEGKERFAELLGEAGPSAWEDETFGVHVAFFAQTDAVTRLRVLEGRRGRLEERREGLRAALARMGERMDLYTEELQRHGLDSVDREVRWLSELIDRERTTPVPAQPTNVQPTNAQPTNAQPTNAQPTNVQPTNR